MCGAKRRRSEQAKTAEHSIQRPTMSNVASAATFSADWQATTFAAPSAANALRDITVTSIGAEYKNDA